MIKTLSKAQKMEREKFRIPRSVQDAIPIRRIFADGIFQIGNQYSKTWSFTDINYAIANTILGLQNIVRKVYVEVVERNNELAALRNYTTGAPVVAATTKSLQEGARVRTAG